MEKTRNQQIELFEKLIIESKSKKEYPYTFQYFTPYGSLAGNGADYSEKCYSYNGRGDGIQNIVTLWFFANHQIGCFLMKIDSKNNKVTNEDFDSVES